MSDRVFAIFRRVPFFLLFCVLLCSCSLHDHEWQDATCTAAKTCSICGNTDGNPLGHQWAEATCTTPKTCSVCGETKGGTCSHKWESATCESPKTCSICGATTGEPRGHYAIINTTSRHIVKEPTCLEEGIEAAPCVRCGVMVESQLPKSFRHSYGEYQILQEPTFDSPGKEVRYCTVCGEELDSREIPQKTVPANNTGSGGSVNSSTGGNQNNFNAHNNTGQQDTTASYVLNTSTMKFHRPSCRDVPRIASQNYSTSNLSRSDLIASGYKACGHCNP